MKLSAKNNTGFQCVWGRGVVYDVSHRHVESMESSMAVKTLASFIGLGIGESWSEFLLNDGKHALRMHVAS